MPHLIGIEFAREVRKMQEKGEIDKKVKIVLISGDNIYSENFKRDMSLFDDK